MSDPYFQQRFARRIGGAEFGKGTGCLPVGVLRRRARYAGWRSPGRDRDLCPAHPKGEAR